MAILNELSEDVTNEYNEIIKKVQDENKDSNKTARLGSRAAKGSLSHAKSNYSKKENELFNDLMSR